MRRAAVTAVLVRTSAEMFAVETYRDVKIGAARRTGRVQFNESISRPVECRLEEAHRAS